MQLFRLWLALGALNGAMAVAGAAFTSHGAIDPARLRTLSAGVQMQGWHAIALLVCGLLATPAIGFNGWPTHLAAIMFLIGIALFCGAVWVPQFGGPSLGMTAPVGGTLLIAAWLVLALGVLLRRA